MQRLIIATHNYDKMQEIRVLLSELSIEIISIDDILSDFEVEEDRITILENAAKKAIETSLATGYAAIADDTGLFIRALNGEPGVKAARYAGQGCSYDDNRKKVIDKMKGINDRFAEFKTVVAFAEPKGLIAYREGIVTGLITKAERGGNGFGYDSIFEVAGTLKTYAEMNALEKNNCSHRGLAIKIILPIIFHYYENG